MQIGARGAADVSSGAHGTALVSIGARDASVVDAPAIGAAPASYIVSSIAATLGDIDGGSSVTIVGSGFLTATGATVGGVALTSFVFVDDLTITGVIGAHASGVVDVVVNGPAGASTGGTGLFEYFSPAQLSDSLWLRGDFGTDPWAGVASSGSSSSHNFSSSGTASTGAAVRGHVPAHFDGSTTVFSDAGAHTFDTYVSAGSGYIGALFKASTAAAHATQPYDDPALVADNGGNIGLHFSDSGLRGFISDSGGLKAPTPVACGTGAYHYGELKWDGSNVKLRVDGGSWSSLAAGNQTVLSLIVPRLGVNYSLAAHFTGDVEEFIMSLTAFSDPTSDKILGYMRSRYGVP